MVDDRGALCIMHNTYHLHFQKGLRYELRCNFFFYILQNKLDVETRIFLKSFQGEIRAIRSLVGCRKGHL